MSPNQLTEPSQPKAVIHGPISAEEAKTLRQGPESSEAKAVLAGLGATAGEESVALVTVPGASGEEKPSHFVTLDTKDLGTELMPDRGAADLNLPTPEAAHADLVAKQEQPEQR